MLIFQKYLYWLIPKLTCLYVTRVWRDIWFYFSHHTPDFFIKHRTVRADFFLSLLQDYLACSSDLQEVLQQDPNVQEAEKELEEVTVLLRQSLANASSAKPRKAVPITEVECTLKLEPVQISSLLLIHEALLLFMHKAKLWLWASGSGCSSTPQE